MALNTTQFSSISYGGKIRNQDWSTASVRVFPVIQQVGNFVIFPKFEIKSDAVISHINFNSKQHDKCKVALKLIHLATISNLFPFKVEQICQYCQLCVLLKNSVDSIIPLHTGEQLNTDHAKT